MSPEAFLREFGHLAETEGGLRQLRSLLRLLAVSGRLSERQHTDESVAETLSHAESLKPQAGPRKRSRDTENDSVVEAPAIELPSHWAWTKFVDVAVIQSNLVPPSKYTTHPHVAPDNIEKETGKLLEYRSIGEDGVRSNKHLFYPGQILYSKIRPNLSKAVEVDFEGLCSADMYPLLPLIDRSYLLLFILSEHFLKQVVINDNRVAMPKVNQEQLSGAWVAVPPLPEQKRIVEKVDQLMALCDELEAKQKEKREKAVSFNKAALNAVVHAPDKSKLKSSWSRVQDHFEVLYELPENVKELRQTILELAYSGLLESTSLRDFIRDDDHLATRPRSWHLVSLGEVVEVIDPNPSHRYPNYTDGVVPLLSTREFDDALGWDLSKERHKLVPMDVYEEQNARCSFDSSDVIFARKGRLGLARRPPAIAEYCFSHTLFVMKPSSEVFSDYLMWHLRRDRVEKWLRDTMNSNTGVPTLGKGTTEKLPIPLPDLPTQRAVVRRIEQLVKLCEELERVLASQREQGQRLMQAVVESLVA